MKRASRDEPLALRAACSRGVRRRADRGVDDLLLGHVVALERRDGVAAGHHDHPVAQPFELDGVAGGDDDRHAACGHLAQDAVDLGTRAHIDALRRLVRDEDRRLGEHRARHHDLLLVSAGERRDRRLERRRLDRQRGELALDHVDLAASADEGPRREPVERGQRGVLAHVQVDHQALGQAVGRHVGGALRAAPAVRDPSRRR